MKTVKLFGLGLALMTTAVFTGCDKDDDPVSNSAITVADNSALTQNIFADETSGKSGVTFTTTGAWTSEIAEVTTKADAPQSRSSGSTWISISPDHGDAAGNYTIAITLEQNTTGTDRTAVITIVCGDTEIAITVAQKGTKEDGTIPAELAQDEIVDLLTSAFYNSLIASELAIIHTDYNDNENDIIEINRSQKKSLESLTFDNTVFSFEYIENTVRYHYSKERGIVKSRVTLSADFWNTYDVKAHTPFLEYIKADEDWHDFSVYSWTGSGSNYVGTRARDGIVRKLTVTIASGKINTIKWEIPNEIHDITFSYDNVNPAFPAGFDKADFTEYSAYGGNGAFTNTMAADQPLAVDGAEFTGSQIRFYKDGVDMADALYFDFGSPEEWVSGNPLPAGTYQFYDRGDIAPDYWFYCQKGTLGGINYYGKGGTVTISVGDGIYTIEVDMDTYHEYYGSPTTGKIRGTYIGYLTMRNR